MSTQQEGRMIAVRAVTGTILDYNSDFEALFDLLGIAKTDWNGRFLAWLNLETGTTYAEINGAMQNYAALNGATNWSSLGALPLINNNAITTDASDLITDDAGNVLVTG